MDFVGRLGGFIAFVRGTRQQRGQLRQDFIVFELFQIIKNCLLYEPVRGAVDTCRRTLNALTRCVIQLNPHGGGAHAIYSCCSVVIIIA